MSRGPKLAVAVVLGLLAALFGMIYLNTEKRAVLGDTQMITVYVAADDIPPNTPIEPGKIKTRRIPRDYVAAQAILATDMDKSAITGYAIVAIKENEQILRSMIFSGRTPPLSADLAARAGLVAVTVETKSAPQSLGGLLQPRDRVDVLAVLDFVKPPKDKFREVRPLFYNVEVLAVNRTTMSTVTQNLPIEKVEQQALEKVETVTLALPPVAAQQLILTQNLQSGNEIWLILRTPASGAYTYETWNTDRLIQSQYRLWNAEEMQQEALGRVLGSR